jgi:hypothetical protein
MTADGVDIFIGFIESDNSVSWFPSKRGGLLLSDVFPATTKLVFDVPCDVPRNVERYLEVTYGPDWRTPDSNWNHPWDFSMFKEFSAGENSPE